MPYQLAFGVWMLRLISGFSTLGFAAVVALGNFEPPWVRFVAGAVGAVSLIFGLLVPTKDERHHFTVRGYLVVLLVGVFIVGLTIEPDTLGTLAGFVFVGIAVGIASYKETVPAAVLAVIAMALGVVVVVLRSSNPESAPVVLIVVGGTCLAAVFGFRKVAAVATATAVAESLHDPLTLVTNRRGMPLGTGLLVALARRSGQKMGCLIVDVDHFKAVNDSAGHQAGDQMLLHVAAAIEQSSRQGDLLVRLGGDEFALFAVVPSLDELTVIAERIRAAVQQLDVKPRVTACVGGVVHEPGADWDLDELLRRADLQMYAAKDAGRNAICIN